MKFYFVRHGKTDWNDLKKIQGMSNPALNESGRKQAHGIGGMLLEKGTVITAVYTSPLLRARESAEIIAGMLSLPVKCTEALREIDMGVWEGMTLPEVQKTYPAGFRYWLESRRYSSPFGGESYQDLLMRALAAVREIAAKETGNVLIVAHSAVIMALRCYAAGADFQDVTDFVIENGEVTEIDGRCFLRFLCHKL